MPLHVQRLLILASAAMLLTCVPVAVLAHETAGGQSLYERMGGARVVAALSNDLIERAAADPRTQRSWRKVNLKRVKAEIAAQLCSLTDGPCSYAGDSMQDIHAGLDITEAEMFALIEMLREIMVEHDVKLRERNELLALLAPMKRDVVTR